MSLDVKVFELPVFPVADLFPMIAQDELAELAEDIAEHGLQEPIVIAEVKGEWMLVDGRNRLAACQLAGIEPQTRILTTDPTAYVLSANVHRRHLTKGQQAMATALAYPEAMKLKRAGSSSFLKKDQDAPSEGHISKARFVLRHCRDKAEEVLRNAKYPLTVAYEEAQAIVEEQRMAEEERQRQLAALAILREEYSDLAALVDDQRLGLPEAIAAGDQRREQSRLKAEQEAREKLERERREREELARQSKFEEQVAIVMESAPDLAEKMQTGRMDFDSAMRVLAERESTKKAQDDASLDSFYKFSETAASFCNEKNAEFLKNLLVDNSDYYRDRWRRSVRESIGKVMTFLNNKDVYVKAFNEVLNK
jgi:hypothetical protein